MKPDESINALLEKDIATTGQSGVGPSEFESKVFDKVQGRQRRRYIASAVGSLCTVFALSLSLDITPGTDSEPQQQATDVVTASQKSAPSVTRTESHELAYWEDDPFDDWSDEMPEDYELVVDL